MKKGIRKAMFYLSAILAAALIASGVEALEALAARKAQENVVIASYPMSNQGITWTGAGYNGIWGQGGGD